MASKMTDPAVEALRVENALLRDEVEVARQASAITAELVVEQFVKLEEMLHQLEEKVATEQELRERLAAELHEAEERERDLAEARTAAEAANRAKSAFLANMSHELRTPLNAIIGYSEMLIEESGEREGPEFVPDLEKVHGAGKHLLALINDILDLSKIEAGKMQLYLEDFDVAGMVREVASTAEPLVRQKNNTLVVECPEDLGALRADLTRVRQCLFNLLSNAAKFTENGRIDLQVERGTRDDERGTAVPCVNFRVRDSGIGMSAEQVSRLFQAFSQADASTTRRFGGTGLGLAITRHFCRMMGGDIAVTSEPGAGSTFSIWLPVTAAVAPEAGAAEGAPAVAGAPDAVYAARPVLVVDDDPVVRELLERTLAKDGFPVVTASGGEEGLRLARELHPVAITLDVMMPGVDGWAVLTRLKADMTLADIPVIMLTIVDNRNLGYALGAAEYLTKPVDRERLLEVLRRYRRGGGGPVLVVEDDAGTRDMLRHMLERDGWDVAEAENGRAALAWLAASTGAMGQALPEIILLDLMMPEMDGFEFLAHLRQQPDWRGIPVVVVTAKDLTPEDRRRLDGHVERILQKGAYTREQLLAEVREQVLACTRRRAQAEGAEAGSGAQADPGDARRWN